MSSERTVKVFQPFQRVLVKAQNPNIAKDVWIPAIYGGYDPLANAHIMANGSGFIKDEAIIPYEGNEYLLGKTINIH